MKEKITGLAILIFLISGCEKSEINQIDMKGTLMGKIVTYDELRHQIGDNENIRIELEGSDPLIYSTTDSEGKYEIDNIPSGTYNIIFSKEGYGTYQFQGAQILGGEKPLYWNLSLTQNSKITIENFSVEFDSINEFVLKSIVKHNYPAGMYDDRPAIMYFIHTESEPSNLNFIYSLSLYFYGESGTEFKSTVNLNLGLPPGTKIYIIAYGCNPYGPYYYDISMNKIIYTSLGTPSNIVSITLP